MHVISRKRLVEFGNVHAPAQAPLDAWYRVMKAGRFTGWAALKATFGSADLLGTGLVMFDIGGNKYRLVANVHYATATKIGRVYVRHVFTHEEYDRWSKQRRRN